MKKDVMIYSIKNRVIGSEVINVPETLEEFQEYFGADRLLNILKSYHKSDCRNKFLIKQIERG